MGFIVRLVKPQLQRIDVEIQGLKSEIKKYQSLVELQQERLGEKPKKEQGLRSLERDYKNVEKQAFLGPMTNDTPVGRQPEPGETAKKKEFSGIEIASDRAQIIEDSQHDNTIASNHEVEKETTEEKPPVGRIVTVKEGDSLTKLAESIYGRRDKSVVNLLKENNPGINNINIINVGQKIYFPPLPVVD
jgi:phage tail protein X